MYTTIVCLLVFASVQVTYLAQRILIEGRVISEQLVKKQVNILHGAGTSFKCW